MAAAQRRITAKTRALLLLIVSGLVLAVGVALVFVPAGVITVGAGGVWLALHAIDVPVERP
jgi:uncharacterized membrane-anchored protein YitT (DUF2179 family)